MLGCRVEASGELSATLARLPPSRPIGYQAAMPEHHHHPAGSCEHAHAHAERAPAALTAAEVQAFCRGQIAHYKVPRHVRFVEAFPTTVTGKVQKFLMRETMIADLHLTEARTA